jgi:hypothetical protein
VLLQLLLEVLLELPMLELLLHLVPQLEQLLGLDQIKLLLLLRLKLK